MLPDTRCCLRLLEGPCHFFADSTPGLHFHMIGAGAPVLFLHGFPEYGGTWHPLVKATNGRISAVIPDLPGFNLSAGMSDLSAAAIAGKMRHLMLSLGHKKFAVVAHDIGGAVGWYMASVFHENVVACVVISAPHPADLLAYLWQHEPGRRLAYLDRMVSTSSDLKLDPMALATLALPQRDHATDALFTALSRSDPSQIQGLYRSNLAPDALGRWRDMPRCTARVLAVVGDSDPYVPEAAFADLRHRVTAVSRFEVLSGVGHFLPQRLPTLLATKIVDWVDDPDLCISQ